MGIALSLLIAVSFVITACPVGSAYPLAESSAALPFDKALTGTWENFTEDDLSRLENLRELVTLGQKYDHLDPDTAVEQLLETMYSLGLKTLFLRDIRGRKSLTTQRSRVSEQKQVDTSISF